MRTKCALYSKAEWKSQMPDLQPNVFGLLNFIGYASIKDALRQTH